MPPVALSPAEESLLNAVLRLSRISRSDVSVASRTSDRPFDFKYTVLPGEKMPAKVVAWLPLAAIRVAQQLATETEWDAICELSDYPEMADSGDWSAFRDSSNKSVWQMFESCRSIIERPVRTKKIVISVDLEAEVPVGAFTDPITLDLDVAVIRIDGEDGPLPGAKVTGYTTQNIEEID